MIEGDDEVMRGGERFEIDRTDYGDDTKGRGIEGNCEMCELGGIVRCVRSVCAGGGERFEIEIVKTGGRWW